jgi:hypothetical protein
MLNLLAKYQLWGWNQAYDELLAALTSNHVITGETIPVEQTTKGVLLMFQPEDTILFARWLYTSNYEDDVVHWIEHGKGKPERGLCGSLTPELFERLPFIKAMFEERVKDSGRRLYNPSPTSPFFSKVVENGWDRLKPYQHVRGTNSTGKDRLWISANPSHTDLWTPNMCIAVFIKGVSQDEIFREYFPSRDEQAKIATWSFEFPTIIGELTTSSCSPDMWIGIHPEHEHKQWKKSYPSYVSKGVAVGHGAIILNGDMYGNCLGRNYTRAIVPKYLDLEGPYPHYVNNSENIKNRRFTLAFQYNVKL